MPCWMIEGFLLRGSLYQAHSELKQAESTILPNLKKTDLRGVLGQLRQRVTYLTDKLRPPHIRKDRDYTAEWARLSNSKDTITSRGEK